MSLKILGSGFYVPEKIVTNDDLSEMVDTSDEWIMQRVGVHERRVSVTMTASDMAVEAAKNALANSGVSADKLDMIIAATLSSNDLCPTVAGYVQMNIGASCPSFDVNSACSGFIFALDTAVSYIERGVAETVLVIGAERLSKIAMVVTKGDGYLASKLYTAGGNDIIEIPNYAGESPFYEGVKLPPYIFMQGQETFKFAVNKIVSDIKEVTKQAGITTDDIDFIVPHQANIRIIDFASKRLKVPKEKFYVNIDKYGNTSSASVPIAFAELEASGKLKRGNIIAMCAFGGGLSSAACIIKY